jgi:predicted nucleic acid-binding protein
MEHVLVDTGFWFAMFDPRDQNYPEVQETAELLENARILLPWPTLYETLRTKFVKNWKALNRFELFLKKPNIGYLDDIPYREAALELSFTSSLRKEPSRPLSMVDCLIRLIIEDVNIKIDYLATFNVPDFIDVCGKCRVEIL